MNPDLLAEILSCQSLPTLPSVAVEILHRTSNPNVVIGDLAPLISRDQGLAARMLRTVNSSFFGLRQPCPTIDRALVLLGIGPVRSLALGFSLAASLEKCQTPGFDWERYWRRALISAIAARELAEEGGCAGLADEAYLGALMQDIGMVAMHQALGTRYDKVVALTGGDHSLLTQTEVNVFEIGHPDVGAHLAERWRLPRQLSIPIRFHERPTAAPTEEAMLTRLVHLGSIAHDVVTDTDPRPALRRLYERAADWLDLAPGQIDAVVRRVGAKAKDLASVFGVRIGPPIDAERILAAADERLHFITRSEGGTSSAIQHGAETNGFLPGAVRDPLTGAVTREGFIQGCRRGFELAIQRHEPLTLVTIAIESLDVVETQFGQVARDETVIGVVTLVNKIFEPMGGLVCRLAASVLGVVAPGTDEPAAKRAMREVQEQLLSFSKHWTPDSNNEPLPITISGGIAVLNRETQNIFSSSDQVIKASSDAVKAARSAGGNCVLVHAPRQAA
ncbi:MAG: HDOD domain-containing protein [Phycisphaeraceae bacterium]|nr:HDOD domain-containing protein [Phycisphaeraceae bacterium]MCW5762988.1 HDOD domain-containing protein [Phycisphaeraceae bacterium]